MPYHLATAPTVKVYLQNTAPGPLKSILPWPMQAEGGDFNPAAERPSGRLASPASPASSTARQRTPPMSRLPPGMPPDPAGEPQTACPASETPDPPRRLHLPPGPRDGCIPVTGYRTRLGMNALRHPHAKRRSTVFLVNLPSPVFLQQQMVCAATTEASTMEIGRAHV